MTRRRKITPEQPDHDALVEKWPALNVTLRPISELLPYTRNAKQHSPEGVARIAAAISEWGWTNPVIVDELGEIIAGHGRVLAAKSLGIVEIPVGVARGWSEEKKAAARLADNRIAERDSSYDETMLAFELEAIAEADPDLAALTGFDLDPPTPERGAKRKSGVRETATPDYDPQFWISLRGPIADQARVLDAIKKALGEPGKVEIEMGVTE